MIYTAYGLGIESDLALPELPASDRPADVVVRRGTIHRTRPEGVAGGSHGWGTAERMCIWFDNVGAFLVEEGKQITVDPEPDTSPAMVRLFLLGAVMGMLLHQRGLLVLHASAVSIHGRVVAFLADKGQGKSTLATALGNAGHALVTDDVLPVEIGREGDGDVRVWPGFPQIKLWPESLAHFGKAVDGLPRVFEQSEKRLQKVERFAHESLPLERVYILVTGEANGVEAVPVQRGFMSLVQHCFLVQLLQDTNTSGRNLQQTAALMRKVPVKRLVAKRSLDLLPELVRVVEQDVGVCVRA